MMAKTLKRVPAFLAQSGPKVEANSVKVYKRGKILRISNDLVKQLAPDYDEDSDSISFVPYTSKEDQTLVLELAKENEKGTVLRGWHSSPEAKSVLISLSGILPFIGIEEKKAPGTYKAEVNAGTLTISFKIRL